LEPGRQAKTDKPAILDDAIRVLNQLKAEAQELKETNEKLLEEIKSLKVVTFNTHSTTTTIIPSAVFCIEWEYDPFI
jgi:cell division septum initiation protein DivIVA